MKLDIEIISGRRKGEFFSLYPSQEFSVPRIYLLENEAINFVFQAKEKYDEVSLLIGEFEWNRPFSSQEGEFFLYTFAPVRRSNYQFAAFFHNFFGNVEPAIRLLKDDEYTYVSFEAIDVLASKINARQTEQMINFLFAEEQQDILNSISPTSIGLQSSSKGIAPGELLRKIEDIIERTEIELRGIYKNPITKLISRPYLVQNTGNIQLDDQIMAWMMGSLEDLKAVDSIEEGDFEYEDVWYSIRELMVFDTVASTDIYENKIIHLFLRKLRISIESFRRQIYQCARSIPKIDKLSGYVSFYDLISKSENRSLDFYLHRLRLADEKIKLMQELIQKFLPVKNVDIKSICITERSKCNNHYRKVMLLIKDWFREHLVEWNKLNSLAHVNNTPKLFELYSFLSVNKFFLKNRMCVPGTYTSFVHPDGLVTAEVIYDRPIYKLNHPEGNGINSEIVNTEIEKYYKALRNFPNKKWTHKYDCRRPDILIKIKNEREACYWVMDAKYKKCEDVYEEDLPVCSMKYIHGIHSFDGVSRIRGLILLSPSNEGLNGYIDYHTYPYHLFGVTPVFPVIGLQSLSINDEGIEQSLSSTLARCLNLSVGNA